MIDRLQITPQAKKWGGQHHKEASFRVEHRMNYFWAKTLDDGTPGISVRDHCLNVGCVAEALLIDMKTAMKAGHDH